MATSKYDTTVDLANANTSHAHMVDLVGSNKRVLDVGCSTGYLARELVAHGCRVWGVEYDAEAAQEASEHLERVVVGDLEQLDLVAELGREAFDVVVFGDVLEHLRDPLPVLAAARPLLARGGSVVVSVPNVGHGAVRLALLRGDWTYRSLGLLDETHLRFFTRPSLETLLKAAGLVAVELRRTTAGLFETEQGIKPEDYPAELVEEVLADPDATTYQFVVRAIADDADAAVTDLHRREEEQRARIHALERELDRLRAEAEAERERADAVAGQQAETERALAAERERSADLAGELAAVYDSRTMRAARLPRRVYGALRGAQVR